MSDGLPTGFQRRIRAYAWKDHPCALAASEDEREGDLGSVPGSAA